jgi:uncharacterized protein
MRQRIREPFLALLTAVCAGAPLPVAGQASDGLVAVDVTTIGMDLLSGTPLALLRDRDWQQFVPIWIGAEEAQAIARAIQGAPAPRPMTHDLLANVIGEMGGTVEEVAVHGVDPTGQTLLGRVRIRMADGPALDLDSRPSDALALAVRTGALVRVAPELIQAPGDLSFLAMDLEYEVVRTLGTTLARLSPERRRELELPNRAGLLVMHVSEEMAELGLRRGDLVVDVNGDVPRTPMAFVQALGWSRPTDAVRIVYLREGEERLLLVPPGSLGRPVAGRQRG